MLIRAVDAFEFAQAWENIETPRTRPRPERRAALREQLRAYLENRIGQSEWLAAVHAVRGFDLARLQRVDGRAASFKTRTLPGAPAILNVLPCIVSAFRATVRQTSLRRA